MTDTPDASRGTRVPSRAHFEADLIRRVLAGDHAPGSKLPSERVLALTSGLSRPVIREVLRSLAERGLIDIIPARGAFVRSPNSTQLAGAVGSAALYQRATPRDLIEAREMIEAKAARGAATRATDAEVVKLRELVQAFDDAGTTVERAQRDLALHAYLAQLSGNPVLGILFSAISSLVVDLQLRSLADPVVLRAGAPLHHDIADAVARHDPDAAAAAMSRHIRLALELYGSDLDARLDELAVRRLETTLGDDGFDRIVDDMLFSHNW